MTNQVSPLGAPDFSQYLPNIANSGADILINVNWGHDAVLSIQQAKQFGVHAKMKLVVPYQMPFLAKEVGPELTRGRLCRHRFLVDAGGQVSAGQDVRRRRSRRSTVTSRNGAPTTPICSSRIWARMVSRGRHASIRRTVIKAYEKGENIRLDGRRGLFPHARTTSSSARSIIVRGKAPKDMKNKEDYWEVLEVVPGEPLMQKPDAFGCKLGDYT